MQRAHVLCRATLVSITAYVDKPNLLESDLQAAALEATRLLAKSPALSLHILSLRNLVPDLGLVAQLEQLEPLSAASCEL